MAEELGNPLGGARPSGAMGMLAPGSRIASYVIEEQIGTGGMSVVYRARDEVLGRLVAVKVLSPALASDEEFRTRFLRESRAVAAVDESHIVPVYGAGEADGVLYIATRFVADGDLSRLQRAAGGPLPPAQVADLISQIAWALDAAHAVGLVHRDVKPGNILVERIPGRPEHAYLSDFGLSKSTSAGATGLTAAGRFLGTPDYCAPEQVTGGAIDGRVDQYSLACVAFSLLAGTVPFGNGDSMARLFAHVNSPVPALTSIRPKLPVAVNGVLTRGMAKKPADRYGSCTAFATALRGALGVGQVTVPPQGPGPAIVPGTGGFDPTLTAGAWQYPSIPPGAPGRAGQPLPAQTPAGSYPMHPGGSYPPGGAYPPGGSYPPGGGAYPPGAGGPYSPPGADGSYPMGGQGWPQGPGPAASVPGSAFWPGPRPPRRNTGLIVGGSVAALVLVAGVIAGIALTGQHGKPGGTSASSQPAVKSSSPAASSSPANQSDRTGTATLVGTLSAPGGHPMTNAFFSTDGTDIVASSGGADVYVFSAQTQSLVKAVSVASGDEAWPVALSSDDQTLYAVNLTTWKIDNFNIANGEQSTYPLPRASDGETFGDSLGSNMIGLFDENGSGSVAEYDLADGREYTLVPNPGRTAIVNAEPDGDGKYMLVDDKNGTAYLVDTQSKTAVGTFKYPYTGASTIYPAVSLDGSTVYVPGGKNGPARLWDRSTSSYITPTSDSWPRRDNGVILSTDSRFATTSPTSASAVMDIWNIAARSHLITVNVPGSANQVILNLSAGASLLLSTEGWNTKKDTFTKLEVWSVPAT